MVRGRGFQPQFTGTYELRVEGSVGYEPTILVGPIDAEVAGIKYRVRKADNDNAERKS